MIELKRNDLVFTFPEIHRDAQLKITFQRTLRIPDDDNVYPLPPGLGNFPLRHVDDFSQTTPERWAQHGGVMMPMYQSEALWINFSSKYLDKHRTEYPFAVKIATGKTNAVTGDAWSNGLNADQQDYMVAPEQPWLDGYCVEKGLIRQFVAIPLGSGYSAEEQLTEKAEHGGMQIIVYSMKKSAFEERFPERNERFQEPDVMYSACFSECEAAPDMGLAPGGKMKQEIYEDPTTATDRTAKERTHALVGGFVTQFQACHQTILCRELLGCDLSTTEGFQQAKEQQLFKKVSPRAVQDAAEIVSGLLQEATAS